MGVIPQRRTRVSGLEESRPRPTCKCPKPGCHLPLSSQTQRQRLGATCALPQNFPRQIRGTLGWGSGPLTTRQDPIKMGESEKGHWRLQEPAWKRIPSLLFPAKPEPAAVCSRPARSPSALGPGGRVPSADTRPPRPAPRPPPPDTGPPASDLALSPF